MVHEENPSLDSPAESLRPVDAILVSESDSAKEQKTKIDTSVSVVTAELVDKEPSKEPTYLPLENLPAKGGAITSIVLGVWSIAGAFISYYSIINAFFGLAFGCWGLSANVRWPWMGLVLSILGVATCMAMVVLKAI